MPKINFTDRVALVTGGGGGLGREYALELARRGAKVIVNDLGCDTSGANPSSQMANVVVDEIRAAGGVAIASPDDISTRTGGAAAVQSAIDNFGRLDIAIVNAGLLRPGRFEDQTDEQIDLILNVNLKQGYYVGQPAFRQMKAQGYGRFVFMGSAVGMFGDPWGANYGPSKAGLFSLSNIIALEGAKYGIKSNVVLPTARSRMEEQIDPAALQDVHQVSAVVAAVDYALIGDQLIPVFNMPLTVYLASDTCQETHGVFSSVAGRYARAAVSVGCGWRDSGGQLATVEDVAQHWAEIADDRPVGRPHFVHDEFRIVIDQIKAG